MGASFRPVHQQHLGDPQYKDNAVKKDCCGFSSACFLVLTFQRQPRQWSAIVQSPRDNRQKKGHPFQKSEKKSKIVEKTDLSTRSTVKFCHNGFFGVFCLQTNYNPLNPLFFYPLNL